MRQSPFWNLLLVASFIAASVSLLTTGLGLVRYLSPLLAWPLAIAVQLGLFGLAWLIAVGRRRLRGLVVALYCLTMPFSVLFSYVMLQSELTAEIKPEEAQRALYDELRSRASAVAEEIGRSAAASRDLGRRLDSWVAMERDRGWTTATCDEEPHCYLEGVCERVQRRVETWEERTGSSYRQGPGQALIFGLLEAEKRQMTSIAGSLEDARRGWIEAPIFETGIDNRERLRRYDVARAALPARDIEAVRCEAVTLPPAPPFDDFARDAALGAERPVYAFDDLVRMFRRGHEMERSDFATLFAFFLALFIDVFVLVVALGAAVMNEGSPGGRRGYPAVQPVPPEWSEALRRDITTWIDGALLEPSRSGTERREFLTGVLDALRFDGGRRAVLVPRDASENRFAVLLTSARAATPVDEDAARPGFQLEEWVYPALTRYLAADPGY